MNQFEMIFKIIADEIGSAAPFAFAAFVLITAVNMTIRLFNFTCRYGAREMYQIKKDIEKCQDTVLELEKKYRPISPCDFHSSCKDCHLYDTSFCWKIIAQKEREKNERQ